MPNKMKPIKEVIANPPQPSREKYRETQRERIERQPPPRPTPEEQR